MMTTKLPTYDKYKPSGVEWLGEIPEHWEITRIKNLFKEINERSSSGEEELLSISQYTGVTRKSDKLEEGDLLTTASTLEGYKKVYKGDLVSNIMLAWNGSLGFSPFDGITSPAYCTYRLQGKNSKQYFHYLLRTELYKAEFKRNSSGVIDSRLRLYSDDFFRIVSLCPPLPEQTAIAQFLDRKTALIDQAIDIKQKQIELLKERRQILIHQAVTRGLNPEVKMKDSGVEWIGEVPEHWEVKRLKYILKSQGRIGFKGYTTSDLVDRENGALTLGATHFDWEGRLNLSEPVFISWKKYFESPEIMVSKGDILIVQRGSTCGKVALINEDLGPTTINPSLVLLKEITEFPEYIFLSIKVVLNGILNLVSNTAIPMLTQFQINNIEIPIPPSQEQEEIVYQINNDNKKLDTAITLKQQEIAKLQEYKATLINSAVTGKIKIK